MNRAGMAALRLHHIGIEFIITESVRDIAQSDFCIPGYSYRYESRRDVHERRSNGQAEAVYTTMNQRLLGDERFVEMVF
jgi:hypothetical protein